ncbi:MAG: hypothetical protein WC408_04540 [Candidatus Micrarchaeia archaeon]|jgi:hypothetical protein
MIQPLAQIALYEIYGKPLVIYLGMLTLLCFCITAYIGYLVTQGKTKFANHKKMVLASFLIMIIPASLAFSIFF